MQPDCRAYVLIVNWNGWADTLECLETVFRQTYGDYRVVVCDNNSGNDSLQYIRKWAEGELTPTVPDGNPLKELSFPPVPKPISYVEYDRVQAETGGAGDEGDTRLVLIQTGANLGFAGGNNVGIRYVLSRRDAGYIWLLNNDTAVDPGALVAAISLAEDQPDIGIVGSKILYYDDPSLIQVAAGGSVARWNGSVRLLGRDQRDHGQWDEPTEVGYVTGASLLAKERVIRTTGLLDARYFMYYEELDWCVRARQHGWRLVYSPDSKVWHKEGKSVGQKSPLQDYYGTRSMLLFVQKFYPYFLPVAAVYSVYRYLLPKIVRGQLIRARAVMRAYAGLFR